MKCVDMYLWEVVLEMDIANSLIKHNNVVSDKTRKLYKKAVGLSYCRYNLSFEEAEVGIKLFKFPSLIK